MLLAALAVDGVIPTTSSRHVGPTALSADLPAVNCHIEFTGANELLRLPPQFVFETYNPTAIRDDVRGFIGMVRVVIYLRDQRRNNRARRDLLAEFDAPASNPCRARMLRLLGEGEDPRMIRTASGRAFAHFQRYEKWSVKTPTTSYSFMHRQMSLLEWGLNLSAASAVDDQRGLLSSRLIFRKTDSSPATLLTQTAVGESEIDRIIASQQLLGSCDVLNQTSHVRCEGLRQWTMDLSSSYVEYARVPAVCQIDLAGALQQVAKSPTGANTTTVTKALETLEGTLIYWSESPTFVRGSVLLQSNGFLSEKNWSPFPLPDPAALGIVYSFEPFIVGTLPPKWEEAAAFRTIHGQPQPGCNHCYLTATVTNVEVISQLLTQGLASSRTAIMESYGLPQPTLLDVQKKGDSAIHLNGVPLLPFARFAGREDVLLGIVHMVSEATWASGDVKTGSAVLYTHYFFLAAAAAANSTYPESTPIYPVAISKNEIPLENDRSIQTWFGDCQQLMSSVQQRRPWRETGGGNGAKGAACALKVAFVSGFELADDTLHIFHGVGDSKSSLLRMPVSEAEKLFTPPREAGGHSGWRDF